MASDTRVRSTPSMWTSSRKVGLVVLILGLIGVVMWAAIASFTSGYGTVKEDTIVFDVAAIGAEDPVNHPGLWTGRDEAGNIVWEGTEEEWQAVTTEASSEYQNDLRIRWLYPSAAIAVVGLVVYMIGRRRSDDSENRV